MLLENLKELKKASNMTYEEIAIASRTPESTVKNIFSGKCEPLASTLYRIVTAMNGSLDDVLADTNIVLSPKTLVEVQKNAEAIEMELETLRKKVSAQETEILLLQKELKHKDEIFEIIKYFAESKQNS